MYNCVAKKAREPERGSHSRSRRKRGDALLEVRFPKRGIACLRMCGEGDGRILVTPGLGPGLCPGLCPGGVMEHQAQGQRSGISKESSSSD